MLTTAQLAPVKADILADSALNAFPNNSDGNSAIAAAYAVIASPDYWVWRTMVPEAEIYEVTTDTATTWDWTTYIAQSLPEQGAWRQMVSMRGGMNPSLANVRAGFAKIFAGGTAGPTAQRAHLTAVARRKSNRVEKLLANATAGGSGTRGSTANPDTLSFEGNVSFNDVEAARNS